MKFFLCFTDGKVLGVKTKNVPIEDNDLIIAEETQVPEKFKEFWARNKDLADRIGTIRLGNLGD